MESGILPISTKKCIDSIVELIGRGFSQINKI